MSAEASIIMTAARLSRRGELVRRQVDLSTQTSVARTMGVGVRTVGRWCEGQQMSVENAHKWAQVFGVALQDVLRDQGYGDVLMAAADAPRVTRFVPTDDEIACLKQYRTLGPVGKQAIDGLLRTLVEIAERQREPRRKLR